MFSNIHGKRSFSHTGSGRQDNQFRVVEPSTECVEISEASFDATKCMLVFHTSIHAYHYIFKNGLDRLCFSRTTLFKNRENLFFGLRKEFSWLIISVICIPKNVGARINKRPKHCLVTNDMCIVRGMGCMGDRTYEFCNCSSSSNSIKVTLRS